MAAPKGNQFWKLRMTTGRKRVFKEPEQMWKGACQYFTWCDANPLIEIDYRGKDIIAVNLPHPRPYLLTALCLYFDVNSHYFAQFEDSIPKMKDRELAKGFSSVITRIRDTIYSQKFEGAAVGFFNHNIIARDLGLADKKEVDKTTRKISTITVIKSNSHEKKVQTKKGSSGD